MLDGDDGASTTSRSQGSAISERSDGRDKIGYLLKRPVGCPPHHVRRYYANFPYRAASWDTSRRVVAKVEWHPGELYPRVGFIVTNMSRPAERVAPFYNKRGTCEQWIKEGKNTIMWTRLSCCAFVANAVRLQLHALAYTLANFMRTLALPEAVAQWSLTTLREKLIKIGTKVVRHARYAVFQMAEVAVPKQLFEDILRLIAGLRSGAAPSVGLGRSDASTPREECVRMTGKREKLVDQTPFWAPGAAKTPGSTAQPACGLRGPRRVLQLRLLRRSSGECWLSSYSAMAAPPRSKGGR